MSASAGVAIVGAGPAGLATALRLARLGVREVVLLDAAELPRDKTCGSGLSPSAVRVLEELDVWSAVEPLAYPITGARIVSPRGREAFMQPPAGAGSRARAAVCLRRTLDHAILCAAREAGVRFIPGFRAREPLLVSVGGTPRWVGVRAAGGQQVRAQVVVIASGALARLTTRPIDSGVDTIHTIMGWWEGVPFRPHTIEVIWDPRLRPYYGWLFPESPHRVNIGITYVRDRADRSRARALLEDFLARQYGARLRAATPIGRWQGQVITSGRRIGALTSPGRIVVGEAGRMAHPATGEGIYQALRSGVLAGDAIASILRGESSERDAFAAYERRCAAAFQTSFRVGRGLLSVLETPLVEALVGLGASPLVQRGVGQLLFPLAREEDRRAP